MDMQTLLQVRRDQILEMATKHGISNVRVFGSAARGESGPDSDIDLLVEFDEGHSLLDPVALIQDLEEVLRHPVDVVTDNSLHWYIRDRVLEEAVAL